MRRSLWYVSEDGDICRRANVEVAQDVANSLVRLVTADTEAVAMLAMQSLGAPPLLHTDPEGLIKMLSRHALVCVGPTARKMWHQDDALQAGAVASCKM